MLILEMIKSNENILENTPIQLLIFFDFSIYYKQNNAQREVVLKNNQPSAVILSPEEYIRLTEIEEDYFLLLEANLPELLRGGWNHV